MDKSIPMNQSNSNTISLADLNCQGRQSFGPTNNTQSFRQPLMAMSTSNINSQNNRSNYENMANDMNDSNSNIGQNRVGLGINIKTGNFGRNNFARGGNAIFID